MKVQVLGAGCRKCNLLYQNLKTFIEKNNLDVEIEYIDDLDKLLEAKVLMPTAVFIDEVKKSEGRIPTEAQFKEWFQLPYGEEDWYAVQCKTRRNSLVSLSRF